MGWTPLPRRLVPPSDHNERGHPRLASSTWQSGVSRFAAPDGSVAFRRSLSRPKALRFPEQQPKRIVEACGSYRGREKHGCEVRLLLPVYVKPFVKRERRGGRGRRSRVSTDVRRREDRGTAGGGRRAAWRQRTRTALRGRGVRHCISAGRYQRQEACAAGVSRAARSCALRPLKQGFEREDRRATGRRKTRTRG